ncbi:MAG: single-stranded-DNA-specific exonuclease RecJ [Chthoniobacterales bacterium]
MLSPFGKSPPHVAQRRGYICHLSRARIKCAVERRWIISPQPASAKNGIPWTEICDLPCMVSLLQRKNFSCADDVHDFLQPRLRALRDPFLLPQMDVAVARILTAIDNGERIVLFGDYDVDGVTSLALLAEMLRAYGAAPELFLPLRMEEGYGLSRESVERCWEAHQPQLLIAVDCGTSSLAEVAELNRRGANVIILDHHEPKDALPDCVALVNPKLSPSSEFRYLCTVGIVFKVCHALLKTRPNESFDLKAHLALVALGTVADIVPLEGENRTFVQHGLRELARSARPGVRELIKVAGVRAPLQAEDIGFRLGPRLNAAGRLATAEKALRLLLTNDEAEAAKLASLLDGQNRERQGIEKEIFAAADEQVAASFDSTRDAAIVVGARDWHPGVLGIVASRLARKYHRPTVVIGFESDGAGKGSGRSIEGLSLVEALGRCAPWLEKFGGHEMAAGLSMREENLTNFAADFRRTARELITDEALEARLNLDQELMLCDLKTDLLYWHEILAPFGSGNAQPIFFARGVEPVVAPRVLKEKHLLLRLRQQNHQARAIFFDGAAEQLPAPPWDVAFRLHTDDYLGQKRLQMHVQALRATGTLD